MMNSLQCTLWRSQRLLGLQLAGNAGITNVSARRLDLNASDNPHPHFASAAMRSRPLPASLKLQYCTAFTPYISATIVASLTCNSDVQR